MTTLTDTADDDMPVYTEVLYSTGRSGSHYLLDVFTQPRRQRLIAEAYKKWWRLTQPVTGRLEIPLKQLHRRKCHDACSSGFRNDTGERVRMCAYIPLSNRQDCRLHELGHRHRVHIHESVVTYDEARQLGWTSPDHAARRNGDTST